MKSAYLVGLASVLASSAEAFTTRSWDEAFELAASTVSQLTLDEKVGITSGVGQFGGRCVGVTSPVDENENVSIPGICMQDGPAGLRLVQEVTGFPAGINAASTFSRRLMRARGAAMAEEARTKGVHVFLAPALDISRNPKGGRNWESFGPDPYLNGEGGFETVTGIQSVGVQACAKHFIANNQEHWRYGLTANVDDRTLHEIYLYPFLRAIDADVSTVMCAYNRVNGTSSCHNEAMLGDDGLLRSNGFKGAVISDWGATHDSTEENANAGLDVEMPGDWILIGGGVYGNGGGNLKSAVNSGDVSEERLDEMVMRVLAPYYKLGQEEGYPEVSFDVQHSDGSGDLNLHVNARTDAHTALVREIGAASAVLLKNVRSSDDGRGLPLNIEDFSSVALIGKDADWPNLNCNDLNECNDGTMSIGWGSGSNSLEFIVPPVVAVENWIPDTTTLTQSLSNDLNDGAEAAAGKPLALVFVNAMSGELGFYSIVEGNQGDRNDLALWWKGGSLVERVAAVCNNTIVVVHSVGPVSFSWSEHENITAIIYAGAPGEQTGPSIIDVLSGAYNPSGRLPFSISEDEEAYGTEIVYNSAGFPELDYTEGLFIDYRYMDANGYTPRFEFGYGLSYTTFDYADLAVSSSSSEVTISFTVSNTGGVDGTEIPQLYLGFPESANEPARILRGFEDVALAAGESKVVEMTLNQRERSIWDVASQSWVIPSGTFEVFVGASIKDIRLTGSF